MKKNLYCMYGIALLQGMVFYAPIATLYRQTRGVSIFQMGLIESVFLALTILLELPWGVIADRFGYRNTLLISNMIYFISKLVFWQATGFWWFFAERILLAISIAGLSGCDSAYLFLAAKGKNTTKIFGIYDPAGTAGMLFAAAVFTLLLGANDALAGFATTIPYFISVVLTVFLDDLQPEQKNKSKTPRYQELFLMLWQDKRFFLFLAASMLLTESHQAITVFLSQIQYVQTGLSQRGIGAAFLLVTIMGLMSVFSGKLERRFGTHRFGMTLFSVAICACALLALTHSAWLSVLGILLLRMAAALFIPLGTSIQNKQIKTQERATMLSAYAACMRGGAILINLLLMRLAQSSIRYAMAAGVIFCMTGMILYRKWQKTR